MRILKTCDICARKKKLNNQLDVCRVIGSAYIENLWYLCKTKEAEQPTLCVPCHRQCVYWKLVISAQCKRSWTTNLTCAHFENLWNRSWNPTIFKFLWQVLINKSYFAQNLTKLSFCSYIDIYISNYLKRNFQILCLRHFFFLKQHAVFLFNSNQALYLSLL